MKMFNRCIAQVLIVCTLGFGMPLPVSAGMVTTERIQASAERDKLKSYLNRAEVLSRMQALGVDVSAAAARVDALTDEEVQNLVGRIDQLPAGGDIVGAIVFVFLILLITDILGLTKVFPFTRPIK